MGCIYLRTKSFLDDYSKNAILGATCGSLFTEITPRASYSTRVSSYFESIRAKLTKKLQC